MDFDLPALHKTARSLFTCSPRKAPDDFRLLEIDSLGKSTAQLDRLRLQRSRIQGLQQDYSAIERETREHANRLASTRRQVERLSALKHKHDQLVLKNQRQAFALGRQRQLRQAADQQLQKIARQDLKKENKALRERVAEQQSLLCNLKNQTKGVVQQIGFLSQKQGSLKDQLQLLQHQIAKEGEMAASNIQQLAQKLTGLEAQVDSLAQSSSKLDQDLKTAETAHAVVKSAACQLSQRKEDLTEMNLRLRSQVEGQKNEFRRKKCKHQQNLADLLSRQRKQLQELARLEAKVEQLQSSKQAQGKANQNLKDKIGEVHFGQCRLQQTNRSSSSRLSKAQEEIARLEERLQSRQQELECLAENAAKQQELDRELGDMQFKLRQHRALQSERLQELLGGFSSSCQRLLGA